MTFENLDTGEFSGLEVGIVEERGGKKVRGTTGSIPRAQKKRKMTTRRKTPLEMSARAKTMNSCSYSEGNPCMHIAARTGKAALRLPRKMAGRTSPSLSALFACILSREAVLPDRVL
jgi:hypothetical protein